MSEKSGSPRVRDVLGVVLSVQVVFAATAAAVVILDPEGILGVPRGRLLAGLLVLAPMAMALVLAVRFRIGHRAERRSDRATSQFVGRAAALVILHTSRVLTDDGP